jgi:hypothetical protein
MISFKVPKVDLSDCDSKELFENTSLGKSMKTFKEELCKVKSLLDEPYKNLDYNKVTYLFESFNCEKEKVVKKSSNFNITNAWLKAYELIDHFKLIPSGNTDFLHFDNASFPGSFVVAAHHYASTVGKRKYKWYASSLVSDTDLVKGHLEDKYGLLKNYPDHWIMNKENDGDLSNPANLLDFQEKLPQVDFYSGDLGFDISQDYNAQETLHLTAHYGQLLCGLLVLKPGGDMLIKQFTFFSETNICNLAILTNFFKEVYIAKPATSKTDNSEVYLVCKSFICSDAAIITQMLAALGDCFKNGTSPKAIFNISSSSNEKFLASVQEAARVLVTNQMAKIKENCSAFNSIIKQKKKEPKTNIYALARKKFEKTRIYELKNWYSKHKINKIKASDRLNMKDTFRQKRHLYPALGKRR